MNLLTGQLDAFEDLGVNRLYEILALRQRVFIVEQHCYYLDCDGLDQKALHLTLHDGPNLVGCARILPPGVAYEEASIGRVAVDPAYRGKTIGRELMLKSIDICNERFRTDIVISAQIQALEFYKRLGFAVISEPYDDAGIAHVKMRLRLSQP